MERNGVDGRGLLLALVVFWLIGAVMILFVVSPRTKVGWVLVVAGAPVVCIGYALVEGLWTEMLKRFEQSRLGRYLDERAAGQPVSASRVFFATLMMAGLVAAVFAVASVVVAVVGSPDFWRHHFELR